MDSQSGELGAFQGRLLRDRLLDGPKEPIGCRVQDQPHLVGGGAPARCPVALELGLVEFDEVFGPATAAIGELIEPLGCGAFQRGHDGADVQPERCRLDAGDDPARDGPAFRGIYQSSLIRTYEANGLKAATKALCLRR